MITLNTDVGIERIKDVTDFVGMPGFSNSIHPEGQIVKSILGTYEFKDRIPCGLANCQQPHNRGYLVQFEHGSKTNIGKDCGKRMFGTDFESMRKKFDQDLKDTESREILNSHINLIANYEDRLDKLLSGKYGAKWVNEQITALTNNSKCPKLIVAFLNRQKRNPTGALMKSYEASKNEIEDIEVIKGITIKERPYYLEKQVGVIEHVSVITDDNNLRTLLIQNVQNTIAKLGSVNPDTLLPTKVRELNKLAYMINPSLDKAEKVLEQARLFLATKNISKLQYLCQDKDELLLFNRLVDSFEKRSVLHA